MPALIVPDKIYYIASAIITLIVLLGIYLMSKVEKAYGGNALSAVAMALAIGLTLIKYDVFGSDVRTALIVIIAGMLVGSALGIWITYAVKMIQMPQTVALLNGFGGGASALVASLTLITVEDASTFSLVTGVLALVVGLVTLFGSLVAAAKLQGIMGSKPVILQGHSAFTIISLVASFVLCGVILFVKPIPVIIAASITSIAFGILFSIRVGGADMPITISLLNSFSGVAGSIAGLAIGDVLLVAIGGIVGASGLILTQIMCRAMNRHLFDILLGKTSTPAKKSSKKSVTSDIKTDDSTGDVEDTVKEVIEEVAKEVIDEMKGATKTESGISALLKNAKDVIFVPGYGMALAQAQSLVKQLADGLEANGVTTRYAIHPVAGRMPGHMNVLLAEVDVPYDKLYEMKDINDDFEKTDLVIVIGANDVLNPAAREAEDTPIYGMPILSVDKAPNIIICNYDLKPGYSGVDNPLYTKETGVTILQGDAKESLRKLNAALISDTDSKEIKEEITTETKEVVEEKSEEANISELLKTSKDVIFVPGYGMALAQAQSLVKQLADGLEANGVTTRYAIHPVAGRMPGHMNVLLAEVDVPYDKLYEMKDINDDFEKTDLVIVIGANDVLNPAAREAEDTPIYGMPILSVDKAPNIIICNYDLEPGYSGVDNPLYTKETGVTILQGDAKESLRKLLQLL